MNNENKQTPHFIIVGAMKSGTTTLMHHLSNHKKIHIPLKELHYFNDNKNYEKGISWYKNEILKGKNEEAVVFGEKTPTYSYQENVAERIYKTCLSTKIVWVFRNPVNRTYSNYLHAYKGGGDFLSFAEAIKREEERIKIKIWHGYKKRSIYHLQVERFLKFFPKEQMLFLLFEDLIKPYSDTHALHEMFNFLQLTDKEFEYHNEARGKTYLPRFPATLYRAANLGLSNNIIVSKTLNFINFYKQKPGYNKMSQEMREELQKFFKPHNETLARLINKNLNLWDN